MGSRAIVIVCRNAGAARQRFGILEVRDQYASVGTAARVALGETVLALGAAAARGMDVGALLGRHATRLELAERFTRAYRHYCWLVASLRDIRLAPFHVLATEGTVHVDKDHVWHMSTIAAFTGDEDPLLLPTPYHVVDLADPAGEAAATAWWEALTDAGARARSSSRWRSSRPPSAAASSLP